MCGFSLSCEGIQLQVGAWQSSLRLATTMGGTTDLSFVAAHCVQGGFGAAVQPLSGLLTLGRLGHSAFSSMTRPFTALGRKN
jgi:hypothetical protein